MGWKVSPFSSQRCSPVNWRLPDRERAALLVAPHQKRYKYLINKVADTEQLWMLVDGDAGTVLITTKVTHLGSQSGLMLTMPQPAPPDYGRVQRPRL